LQPAHDKRAPPLQRQASNARVGLDRRRGGDHGRGRPCHPGSMRRCVARSSP